tara:strand:+ start:423 stop:1367 length:945 start_codon:yes stop_codon:yes gene_type:complete
MRLIKFIFVNFIIFLLLTNYSSFAAIKNNIIAKVGNQIITSYELENKIKTTLILSKEQINQNNIDKIKNLSLNSLINYKLKSSELSRYNLKINQVAIVNQLRKLAINLGISENELSFFFKNNNIDYEKYIDEIRTEFLWQKLIFDIYSKKIIIDENEIITELNNILKKNKKIDEFRLAEIELIFNTKNEKNKLVQEIENSISQIGFANAANKFSLASSAANGGDIGWISSTGLSEQILNTIKNLKPGEISKPLIQVNKIIFLKLLDKRVIKSNEKINIEKLKLSLINKKRNELLNLYSNNHLSKKRNSTLIDIQ